MKLFMLINGIIEILAGLVLFFGHSQVPELVDADAITLTLVKMYGAAAIAAGVFSIICWRNYPDAALVNAFLSTFLIFHIGVFAATQSAIYGVGFETPGAPILHLIMGLITLYFLVRNRRLDAA